MRTLIDTRRTRVDTISTGDYNFCMDQLNNYLRDGYISKEDYDRSTEVYNTRKDNSLEYQSLIDKGYSLYKVEKIYEDKDDPKDLMGTISIVMSLQVQPPTPSISRKLSDQELDRIREAEVSKESIRKMNNLMTQLMKASDDIRIIASNYTFKEYNKDNIDKFLSDVATTLGVHNEFLSKEFNVEVSVNVDNNSKVRMYELGRRCRFSADDTSAECSTNWWSRLVRKFKEKTYE